MTPFVGRGRELAELGSAIDELDAGQGGLVLLAGEAGIGKTRLASEVCAQAIESSAMTVWGRCSELEGVPAYWPWIQVLRRIVDEADLAALIEGLGDAAEEITRLVPELGAGGLSGRVQPGEDDGRFRLFDAIARLLRWWADRRRLVLVLDDLQWSNASSLAVLRHLSPELPDLGILIMAIYRTEEIADDHPAHDLVRETVYGALATAMRVGLHRAAAEALARNRGDRLAAIAYHWFEVAPSGAWEEAASCASQAADQAMASLAFEDAARLYRTAVVVLAGRVEHETRRCELLLAQAEAQYGSGDLGLCLDSCEAAAAMARALGRADLQARAALVLQGIGTQEVVTPLLRLTEDALREVGERDPGLRARLLGQLAAILEFAGRPERNGLLSREALDLAERSNQADALVAALHARHAATTGPDGVDERLALARRLIRVAEDSELGTQALWGRLWRVDAHFQLGELPLLPAELDEIQVLVDRTKRPLFRWHLLLNRASLAHVTGGFADAVSLAAAAFAADRSEQHSIVESHYRNMLAWIAVETGSADELEEAVALAERIPLPVPPIVLARATLFQLALGRTESARRRFEQLMTTYARLPKSGVWLLISAHLAEVAAELGTSEQKRTLFRALAPYHRLFVALHQLTTPKKRALCAAWTRIWRR